MGPYNLLDHLTMVADAVRTGTYIEALRRTVRPGVVVVDLGAGTGVFAMLACRFGARKVYAIEPDEIIEVGRALAAANGFADRIEFIPHPSTEVTLPEQADVIVADLRGVLPWFQRHLPSIVDARNRLLAPDGVLIPDRDSVWIAPAEAPDLVRRVICPVEERLHDLDLAPARDLAANEWSKGRITAEQAVLAPQRLAEIAYKAVGESDLDATVSWAVPRDCAADGLVLWFDTTLVEDVGFSNAPAAPAAIYGQAFFPWPSHLALAAGDRLTVTIKAVLVADDYEWFWDTTLRDEAGRVKAAFQQSTFWGRPLSAARLRKRAADHVPSLNEEGLMERFILELMAGHQPLSAIADELMEKFPGRFARFEDALAHVGERSLRYSR